MPKNKVQVKKIPSGINIVINNSNKIENAPKRRKRYVKKEDNFNTLDTPMAPVIRSRELANASVPIKSAPKTTPLSIYAASYRRPVGEMILPLMPYQPPGTPAPAPIPGPSANDMIQMMGNFSNNLLETFRQIRPYTESVKRENILEDVVVPENTTSESIIPENVINQIPYITEEQQREIRNRNTRITAKREGTKHGNKGIDPQGPYKDMEEYIEAYQAAINDSGLNKERKKKILKQRKKKMYDQGKIDAENGVYPLRHENDEDYMKGYNEYIDNLAYDEFLAEEGVPV